MALGNLQDFVLAITKECSPADGLRVALAPGKVCGLAMMFHTQSATFMSVWQTYDQRSKLLWAARGIDMGLKFTRWGRVYLGRVVSIVHCKNVVDILRAGKLMTKTFARTLSLYSSARTPYDPLPSPSCSTGTVQGSRIC